jgi:hypothetical protein
MNKNLREVCATLDQWCKINNIAYDIVCDEDDLQGVMLFKSKKINGLLEYLQPLLSGIHLEKQKVRGGTILAFSVAAISESVMENMIKNSGNKKVKSSFTEKIMDVFDNPVIVAEETVDEMDLKQALLDSAKKIAAEDQYKDPTIARKGASATSRLKKSAINPLLHKELQGSEAPAKDDEEDSVTESIAMQQAMYNALKTGASALLPKKKSKKSPPPVPGPSGPKDDQSQEELDDIVGDQFADESVKKFNSALNEALAGMATSDGQQPGDLFDRFAKALDVLSSEMQIDLKGALQKQGIKAKESDDRLKIILYTVSKDTGAPVPLHQIDAEMLADKTQFENKLRDIVDLAKGQAPGTDKQQQDIMRNQDQAIRDIATAVSPQDQEENNIETQMSMQPIDSIEGPPEDEEPVEEPVEELVGKV